MLTCAPCRALELTQRREGILLCLPEIQEVLDGSRVLAAAPVHAGRERRGWWRREERKESEHWPERTALMLG